MVVALAALVVLLCQPSVAFGASESAELLGPGAGYASPGGSQPVRKVQLLLRRLGDAPGPIDGLYGPLTTEAVRRFQQAHALAADGIVGPQTMGRLGKERAKLRKVKLERKSPARANPAESVEERPSARSVPEPTPTHPNRAPPESSSGPSPQIAAAVGGLALVLLLVVLWRLVHRRRGRPRPEPVPGPRLGLVCAALLAAYVTGAATGAVFATYASPDDGAWPSTATAEPRPR